MMLLFCQDFEEQAQFRTKKRQHTRMFIYHQCSSSPRDKVNDWRYSLYQFTNGLLTGFLSDSEDNTGPGMFMTMLHIMLVYQPSITCNQHYQLSHHHKVMRNHPWRKRKPVPLINVKVNTKWIFHSKPYYKHHPQAIPSQLVPALKYSLPTPRPPGAHIFHARSATWNLNTPLIRLFPL